MKDLLKECICSMISEMNVDHPKPPFQVKSSSHLSKLLPDVEIERSFPLVVTPELETLMSLQPDENGLDTSYHIIGISIDDYDMDRPTHSEPGQLHKVSWRPIELDGVALSPEDSANLKAYLGEFTSKEEDQVWEYLMRELEDDGPDPDRDWDERFD